MAFDRLTNELNTIEQLADTPNRTSGVTAQQMKEFFDTNAKIIKQFINDIFLPALENGGAQNVGFFPNEHFPDIASVQQAIEYLYDQIVQIEYQGITDNSIETRHLFKGAGQQAVTTDTIRDLAVTATKIAASAITTIKLADSAVTTAKIGDGAVTAAKLGNGAVINAKLGAGAVATDKLANNSVTADKLASGSVTNAKIATMSANKLTGQTAVANGGTGGSTAATARTNLDVSQAGKIKVGDTTYTVRSGSYASGAEGYLTLSTT